VDVAIIVAEIIGKKKHRFPNLACMKIAAYHKSKGDNVELLLYYEEVEKYDKVYISKVFTDTPFPEYVLNLPNVQYGGTGFYFDKAQPLPYEIEHIMPDYHLYDKYVEYALENKKMSSSDAKYYTDYSIGYTTRGCIRGCSFCVNQNTKSCVLHSKVSEFLDKDRPYIFLLDDNVLAYENWRSVFEELNATGKRFRFHQGMDERLLTDEKCEVIFNSKWIGDYIFAFDNYKDKDIVIQKLKLLKEHTNRICKFYCFCGYNHDSEIYDNDFWVKDLYELFERIEILMEYGCLPYIMRHKNYNNSPYRGMYITIARWCNQPSFYKKQSLREYCIFTDGTNKSSYRYITEFENLYPQFSRFLDMKFEILKGAFK
jgi:hypothetical protein